MTADTSRDLAGERAKNKAATIQSYVLSAAVLIGGGWTLFRYTSIDLKESHQKLFEQATLAIQIDARQETVRGRQAVVATVELRNTGTRNVLLDYCEDKQTVFGEECADPFSVKRIPLTDKEDSFNTTQSSPSAYRVLRVGETVRYPFITPVSVPGLYEVTFQVPLPPVERAIHDQVVKAANLTPNGRSDLIYWRASTIVNVRGTTH